MKKQVPLLSLLSVLAVSFQPLRAADVTENWTKKCAACHGVDGAGHTKAGRMAGVKNFTDAAYQKTFTDAQAAKQITEGLKDASGRTKMKAFGDVLTPAETAQLVAFIRTLEAK